MCLCVCRQSLQAQQELVDFNEAVVGIVSVINETSVYPANGFVRTFGPLEEKAQ